MSRYDLLCCDADETLLDFSLAERTALREACGAFGLSLTPALERRYSEINLACWKRYERGELTQPQLRVERYARFLAEIGGRADPAALAEAYEARLACQGFALPGAREALTAWQRKARVIVVTNGIAAVQRGRFARSPFPELLRDIVISQEAGAAKPDPRMIELAMARAGVTDRARVLMLGDSLTSDMLAAANAGVDACWYNPGGRANDAGVPLRWEIRSLGEAEALL